MTARHRALDLLAHRLDRAANRVPDVLAHLDQQRSYATVLKAQDATAPHTAGGIGDPAGETVVQLDAAAQRRRTIEDHIASIELGVRWLEKDCSAALGWRMGQTHADTLAGVTPGDTPACNEAGCTQIPAARTGRDGGTIDDGRCLDCGRLEDARVEERRTLRALNERQRYTRARQSAGG